MQEWASKTVLRDAHVYASLLRKNSRERRDVWRGTERSGKCRITGSKEAEFKTKGTVTGVRAERASNTGGGTFLLDTASAGSVGLSPTLLGFHT